jgi:membrane-associated phospholipid phosphatase
MSFMNSALCGFPFSRGVKLLALRSSVCSTSSAGLLCLGFLFGTAQAGVVEDWNAAFLQAVRKETPPPCLVSRNLPIFHLSIHRAVQGTKAAKLNAADQEAAAAHAARLAFLNFFPSQARLADEVQGVRVASSQALSIATAAVERTFRERENDGSSTTIHYVPSDKPGQWRRTPPNFRPPEFPHWGQVKLFVLPDVTAFRAPPPLALDSEAYAKDFNEVKKLGNKHSSQRTAEQTLIAKFWADFSYTTSPAGHWNDIARELSLQRQLGVGDSAKLFALLNVTLADTCIVIWDTKFHFNFWRPETAIQRADEDGNEVTAPDKTWMSLLPSPPHPDYVSGHSGISGAAAAVMVHFFGLEKVSFEATSDDVKNTKRRFTSFQACAEEIARSRVYGGIHYSSAGREGLAMGRKIAAFVLQNFKE